MKRQDMRTYGDRAEYLKHAVAERRRTLKSRAVALMGGACMLCAYDKHVGVLEFHHVHAETKSFGVSSGGFSRSWQSIYDELQKCVLVCANCHREIEMGVVPKEIVVQLHDLFWANKKPPIKATS
jgi:predicted HNH restriction endonuclease